MRFKLLQVLYKSEVEHLAVWRKTSPCQWTYPCMPAAKQEPRVILFSYLTSKKNGSLGRECRYERLRKAKCEITYHLHIYPQFIYESFHIHYIISLLSRENMNSQLTTLAVCGFIAQLVEHRTGIAEVTGSNPVEALIFFRLHYSNCLNWKFTAKITYHLR